jgi:hypothetical protein
MLIFRVYEKQAYETKDLYKVIGLQVCEIVVMSGGVRYRGTCSRIYPHSSPFPKQWNTFLFFNQTKKKYIYLH